MQEYTFECLKKEGILPQAWSPIGRAKELQDKKISLIVTKKRLHRRTAPLRLSYPPRYTCYPEILISKRMREELDVCDIPITADDMSYLSCMPERDRSGEHPDGLSVNLL